MTFASWVHFGEEIDKGHPAFEQNVEGHNYEQEIALWRCASALMRTESWKGKTRRTAGRCLHGRLPMWFCADLDGRRSCQLGLALTPECWKKTWQILPTSELDVS
jgi:hypothetical protein